MTGTFNTYTLFTLKAYPRFVEGMNLLMIGKSN